MNYCETYTKLFNKIKYAQYNTSAFEIIERDKIKLILKEQKINKALCDDSECAVKIGQLLSVQYILIGSIGKFGGFKISIKFVDVRKATVKYADAETAVAEDNIEEAMEILAKRAAERILETSAGNISKPVKKYFIGIDLQRIFPLGIMKNMVNKGYGGSVKFHRRNLLISNLFGGFEPGFFYFPGNDSDIKRYFHVPVNISFGYTFNIIKNISIVPSGAGGLSYSLMYYNENSNKEKHSPRYALAPVSKFGISMSTDIIENIELSLGSFYHMKLEKDGIISQVIISAGCGYLL